MNSNEGLISIIIPVYKVEKYLNRCVESILAQTYRNFEVILVDDDSPDNCPQMCDDYAQKHSNIHVLHLKNSGIGVSGVRNAGLEKAQGEFIAFIDSDDFVHRDLLYVLKKGFDTDEKVLLSMCSFRKVFDSDNAPDEVSEGETKVVDAYEAMNMLISDQTRAALWGKLYARELFDDIRFPLGKHNEDMFVMHRIMHKAQVFAVAPQELYFYYQDSESLCRSEFNYNMLDMIDALLLWKEHVALYYPALSEKLRSHYASVLLNSCQYLVKKKDDYGIAKYNRLKGEVVNDYKHILRSRYMSLNNKFKTVLLKIGLFQYFFRAMELMNIRKYN